MLRVTPSASSSRAKSYYSTADYYTEGQELVGLWRGKGAATLGLTGVVDQRDWDMLCDNRRPDTGEPLTVRRKADRRVGYDFNFHCPKSVSLLYGLTQDQRILDAFRNSVGETMIEIEAEAKARVRRSGRNEDRVTGNLAWGEFVHFTARPESGIPDPHLHAHCFVFNATFDQDEGRWKAAQFGDLKRDAGYFEAVFHAKLARCMEDLGLETQRTVTGWDLGGIDPDTLSRFSRRTARIEALAEKLGIHDPDVKAELGARTRAGKSKTLSMPELRTIWEGRLTSDEFSRLRTVTRNIGRGPIPEVDRAAHEGVDRAMEHSFERASVVPERTVLAEALKQGVGKASRERIESLVLDRPLVHATRDGRRLVTTREVLAEEGRMLDFARTGRGSCRPILPARSRFNREWLNADQKAAVRHVLESRDRVILIRGVAGAGKTSAMSEVRDALREAETSVYAFAQSATASRGVLREEGFESADTLARLLIDPDLQQQVHGSLLLIDEAGLVGTRTMCRLFEIAARQEARVLLVGDTRQHAAVERGAALRLLEEEAGLMPAEIKEIQRQKTQYKAAVKALSQGDVEDGFRRLSVLGWIREVPDEGRDQALAKAYLDSVRENKSTLVVSPTHAEADRITQEIRRQLRSHDLLGPETREFEQLVPVSLTVGERRDPLSYQPDDVLVFHQNARGYRKAQRVPVASTPVLPLQHADRFTVYRRSRIALSAGDRIRITKNGSIAAGHHRLNNGDLFTVQGFTPEGEIQLNNGWVMPRGYGHLDYGLVMTSHASQSKTVDRVLVGQSSVSFPASSQEQFYVSASRGREQVLVFTDDKAALLNAVSRKDERLSGTELVQHRDRARDRPNPVRAHEPASPVHAVHRHAHQEFHEHDR